MDFCNPKKCTDQRGLAEMLGIGINKANELIHTEGFPAIRAGKRRIIIPLDALDKWLVEQAAQGLDDKKRRS